MTSKRLSNLSCNEDKFIKASSKYQNVLKSSGFKNKLVYTPSNQRNGKQRNRKIICYNPPFQHWQNLLTTIGQKFSTHHRLHKIINRNTVEISYSCMPNMASHISSHDTSIIQESKKSHLNPKTCDCLVAENCLLILNYKQSAVIYRADVTPKIGNQHSYI